MKSLIAMLLTLSLVSTALAGKPGHWIETSQDDFKAGDLDNVVATNLGDLKLSRSIKNLLEQNPKVSATYCLAQAKDGTIYAGTGPEGLLLKIKDGTVSTVATIGEHGNIFSLLIDQKGRLLIGTGGEHGEIFRIDRPGNKPAKIFSNAEVQYIWAMLQTADGKLYAATGPNGQLYCIDEKDRASVVFDSDENNLMCLASDGKDLIYAGTDPNGLVLEINRDSGAMRVLYDAAESEISALVRDAKGNLFASTADAAAAAGGNEPATPDVSGRPDAGGPQVPIPAPGRSEPKPPDLPSPAPGEPLPIPKTATTNPIHMRAMADEATTKPNEDSPIVVKADEPKATADEPKPAGTSNAVYQIDPSGFVTEIFRQPLSIYSMLIEDDKLLLGTGDAGELFQVDIAAGEIATLASVESHSILCLLPASDKRVIMGLANEGGVSELGSGYASHGIFTSRVLDAKQIARFGKMQLDGWLPEKTSLTVATRSGNVEDAMAPGWSKWSDEMPATQFLQVPSTAGRFLQYRLTFAGTESDTPIVQQLDIAYRIPNGAPTVTSVKVAASEGADAQGKSTITWEASDPDSDELTYGVSMRNGPNGSWILIKDKLKEPSFDWETRTVADGRYWIKVEASDAAANPIGQGKTASRVSDSFVVDNTPPSIGNSKVAVDGATAKISLTVVDRTTTVADLEYSVDSAEIWQNVAPSDTIADSPEEAYQFEIGSLSAGAHQITVRATDSKGNPALATFNVTISKTGS